MTAMSAHKPAADSTAAVREQVRQLMLAHRYIECLPLLARLYRSEKQRDRVLYLNYAYALLAIGRYDEALPILDEAIAKFPQHAEFFVCRGNVAHMHGRFEAMLEDYRQAFKLEPSSGKIRYALGVRELMVSNLAQGFEHYAFRTHSELAVRPPVALPRWEGEPLNGKRLFIYAEQGVGDVIMWAGLLPALRAPLATMETRNDKIPNAWGGFIFSDTIPAAVDTVSAPLKEGGAIGLAVPEKLVALLSRSFPDVEVLPLAPQMDDVVKDRYDLAIAMGDLMPLLLKTYTPAQYTPYLEPDVKHAAMLRARYLGLTAGGARRLVGISWHTTHPSTQRIRNVSLDQWAPLFEVPGMQFVSLQYGDHAKAIAEVNQRYPGILHVDPEIVGYADMDALAAQTAAMDEVITIQNATAHLAGGLGIPTTLLLSSASDWRWGVEREDSVWYQSVRIIRQKHPLDWKMPLLNAAHGLYQRTTQ